MVFVWHIPDRLDVELLHPLSAAPVDATVVEEEVELLLVGARRRPDLLQEGVELLLVEGVVLDLVGEDPVARADGSAHGLARLLPSTVLDDHVLVRARPRLLLVASGLEDALVDKDEVAAIADDLVHLLPQLDGQLGVLLVELVLLLRLVLGLHLLELEAIELQDLAEVLGLDDAIWELPMEQLGSLRETQMRLSMHRVWVKNKVQLPLIDRCKGHSL